MSAQLQTQAYLLGEQTEADRWGFASRVAYRFSFLYIALYCLLTQILTGLLPIPNLEVPDLGTLPPFRQFVLWTAENVFRYKQRVVYSGSGSGDKVFDWVQAFCFLLAALVGTCVWSAMDRRRVNYNNLYKWFRVFIRFALAGQLFVYGLIKVFPMQMPFPNLAHLLEPFGNFSPMGVLWSSVGASPGYERFVGSAELAAGLLLIFPGTSMLGALICLIDMIEVFALNMTYDVPVKLFSFHMILMAAFLLLPERSRLAGLCFPSCSVAAVAAQRFFVSFRANRIAIAAQIIFGLLMFSATLYGIGENWSKWGGGAPKSPFYGIWNVDEMAIDGVIRSPLLTDYDRWRRIVFDYPQWLSFQRMDDSFGGFATNLDAKRSALALTRNGDQKWKGQLLIHREGTDHMSVDGQLGPHKVRMKLTRMPRDKFMLISRGFNWIQDYPFNR
jgi:hypothetical protein